MIKRYNKIIITLLLPLYLTGCWDYKDVNKRTIDLSIAIDEVDNEVEFTGEIAKLITNTSQSKGMSQVIDVYQYRSLGKYFEDSRADYDVKITFPEFSAASRVIAFSKKYAEKKV